MSAWILTANDLRQGHVVFLTPAGDWSTRPGDARIEETEEGRAALGRAADAARAANLIIEPEVIPAVVGPDGPWPVRNREQIRALGPTVRRDLGYQAGQGV